MRIDRPAEDDIPRAGPQSRAADTLSAAGHEPSDRVACAVKYRAAVDAANRDHRAAIDAESASADTSPRSAWENADTLTRPPVDALRMPPERAIHILDGDATGGGHRYGTGIPGKTEFPASWDDDKILDAVTLVARSPENVHQQWNQRWKARGEFDNVRTTVIIEPDGTIWTAWPEEGSPGVIRNPEAGAA